MATARMHADQFDVDVALVRRLVDTQLPQYARLPLTAVTSTGTDNALFRLGADLCVRLPILTAAAEQIAKQVEWLPRFAPVLPLPIAAPVATGAPGCGYPWSWLVCPWLPGEEAGHVGPVAEPERQALQLAEFIAALRTIDPTGGPAPGSHNFGRGVPLAQRDAAVRHALAQLHDEVDVAAATAVWEECVRAPAWDRPPTWIHGDLHGGNLLVADGALSGVIDWGGLGVGDPACDVMVAWTYLPPSARETFRTALDVDDATWVRAKGWCLSMGLIALPYYRKSNPAIAEISRRWVNTALA